MNPQLPEDCIPSLSRKVALAIGKLKELISEGVQPYRPTVD